MSASAPWSVKGIDAKAREVAKDLARRSGMTLGEWLNQMILDGEDVGAMISRERERSQPQAAYAERPNFDRQALERQAPEPLVRRRPAAYRETQNDITASRPAPYSSASQPLSSRDLRRRSIFEDRPRYDEDEGYGQASSEMSRVARALESLGSRIEGSETRSASAVRGVSSAVESLLGRMERSESALAQSQAQAQAETEDRLTERLEERTQGLQSAVEETKEALAARLAQAERLIDAQAERLEGLSGHLRDEREKVARVEAQLKNPQVQETVRVVEGALGKLANQLYEGEQRARDTLKDVRSDMVGLSHRLTQMELRDPDAAIQGAIDKVVTRMAQRLETAEAQTSGAIKGLEQAFRTLDARLGRAEERGDVTDPESVQSLTRLANDLSRRVEDSRAELLNALNDRTQTSAEAVLRSLGQRIEASEKRSAAAIEKLGQDVLRIAGNLNTRIGGVEAAQTDVLTRAGDEIRRVAASVTDNVDQRFARSESAHAQALERLGGEIARISERLSLRLSESERRTTQAVEGIGTFVEQSRDQTRNELSERIRQSEDRTAKLLDEARSRLDQKLAQVQTQSLLSESAAQLGGRSAVRAPARSASADLPNPFAAVASATTYAPAHASERAPVQTQDAFAEDEADDALDLSGHRIDPVEIVDEAEPAFDPFAQDDLEAELVAAPADHDAYDPAPTLRQEADYNDEDDDSDPFAEIEVSRKTAPRAAASASPRLAHDLDDDAEYETADDDLLTTPVHAANRINLMDMEPLPPVEDDSGVSNSTRDALAAARAAVRASMEGADSDDRKGGLKLKAAPSRGRSATKSAKSAKEGTFMSAFKASALAAAVVGVGVSGWLFLRGEAVDEAAKTGTATAPAPLAATAIVTPDSPDPRLLKAKYDSAVMSLEARAPGAIDKLKQVANEGYPQAQFHLGTLYGGESTLVKPDATQARLWTERAAQGGVAKAMNNLGLMYYNGDGGQQNHVSAAMWFRKAAERGVPDSQYNLGLLYQNGDGVPINPTEAYKWLSIAAKSGDTQAADAAKGIRQSLSDAQIQKAESAIAAFAPVSEDTTVARSQANPAG